MYSNNENPKIPFITLYLLGLNNYTNLLYQYPYKNIGIQTELQSKNIKQTKTVGVQYDLDDILFEDDLEWEKVSNR